MKRGVLGSCFIWILVDLIRSDSRGVGAFPMKLGFMFVGSTLLSTQLLIASDVRHVGSGERLSFQGELTARNEGCIPDLFVSTYSGPSDRWDFVLDQSSRLAVVGENIGGPVAVRISELDEREEWKPLSTQSAFPGLSSVYVTWIGKKGHRFRLEIVGLNGWHGSYHLVLESYSSATELSTFSSARQPGVVLMNLTPNGDRAEISNLGMVPGGEQRPALSYETFENQPKPWTSDGLHPVWFLVPQAADGQPNYFTTAGTEVEHWLTIYSTNHFGQFKLAVPTLFGNGFTGVSYYNNPDKDQCYWVCVDTRGKPGVIRFYLQKLNTPPNDELQKAETLLWESRSDGQWYASASGSTLDATLAEDKLTIGNSRLYLESFLVQGNGNDALSGRGALNALRTVWFQFRAPVSGRYSFELKSDTPENGLQIFEGNALVNLRVVRPQQWIWRYWTGQLTAGVEYRVLVVGVRNGGGTFRFEGRTGIPAENDDPSRAAPIAGLRDPVRVGMQFSLPNNSALGLQSSSILGMGEVKTLWWRYDSKKDQNIFVDTVASESAHIVEVLEFPLGILDVGSLISRRSFVAQERRFIQPAVMTFKAGRTYLIELCGLADEAMDMSLSLEPDAFIQMTKINVRPAVSGLKTAPLLQIWGMPRSRLELESTARFSERNLTWSIWDKVELDQNGYGSLVITPETEQRFWRVRFP